MTGYYCCLNCKYEIYNMKKSDLWWYMCATPLAIWRKRNVSANICFVALWISNFKSVLSIFFWVTKFYDQNIIGHAGCIPLIIVLPIYIIGEIESSDQHNFGHKSESFPNLLKLVPEYPIGTLRSHVKFQLSTCIQLWFMGS